MIYLGSIGSNLQPHQHVPWAVAELAELGPWLRLSAVIFTLPAAMNSPYRFANALFLLECSLTPEALKARFNALEGGHGRDRSDPARSVKDRTLDLDLLAAAPTLAALAKPALPDYLQPLWPGLSSGQAVALATAELLPFQLAGSELGHRPATIHRDAGTGQIVVVEDQPECLGDRL